MGMTADDQVCSRIDIPFCQRPLIIFGIFHMFDAPVDKDNRVVVCFFRLCDGSIQLCRIVGLEHARLAVGCIPVVGRGDSGGGKDGKGLTVYGTDGGSGCFGDMVAAADTGDPGLLQRIQRITEGILSEIQCMVVGDRDQVGSQILKNRYIFGIRAESILLVLHRLPPETEREFFIQHEQIGIPHLCEHLFAGQGLNAVSVIGCKVLFREHDISGKSQYGFLRQFCRLFRGGLLGMCFFRQNRFFCGRRITGRRLFRLFFRGEIR